MYKVGDIVKLNATSTKSLNSINNFQHNFYYGKIRNITYINLTKQIEYKIELLNNNIGFGKIIIVEEGTLEGLYKKTTKRYII